MKILTFILLFIYCLIAFQAQANSQGLGSNTINNIQKDYNGRVVGVKPLPCSNSSDANCNNRNYKVQVLKPKGNLSVITVNKNTGNVTKVEE